MHPEPTNLLPPERSRALRREYFYRLATVAMFLVCIVAVIHAALLVPTHLLLTSFTETRRAELADLKSKGLDSDEAAFATRVQKLTQSATKLLALGNSPRAVDTITRILEVPKSGIALSGVSFALGGGDKKPSVVLVGVAETRDALRQYQLALTGAPFVAAADLPVSTYAKEAKLPFSMSVTLKTP